MLAISLYCNYPTKLIRETKWHDTMNILLQIFVFDIINSNCTKICIWKVSCIMEKIIHKNS